MDGITLTAPKLISDSSRNGMRSGSCMRFVVSKSFRGCGVAFSPAQAKPHIVTHQSSRSRTTFVKQDAALLKAL